MATPLISVLLTVYDMPRQAMNTLVSLTTPYQQNVDADLYEIIVVENRSANTLDPHEVAALPGNVRYILRDEPGVSPAAAVNAGIAAARGDFLGVMIDGARMVTPGTLHYAAMARAITADAVVAVPGYHLGTVAHHEQDAESYSEAVEQAMLDRIAWRDDGYRLFDIACISGANRHGVFHPLMECNCLFVHRRHLAAIGNADERFQLPGGGALNLYLYRQLCLLPETVLFLLPGEGSFHQLHGGVTTSAREDREDTLREMNEELHLRLGEPFRSPQLSPILLGKIREGAYDFLAWSAGKGRNREKRFLARGQDPYEDEQAKTPLRNGNLPLR